MATQIATSTASQATASGGARPTVILGSGNILSAYYDGAHIVSKEGAGEAGVAGATAVQVNSTSPLSSEAASINLMGSAEYFGNVGGAPKYASYAAGAWTAQTAFGTANGKSVFTNTGFYHYLDRTTTSTLYTGTTLGGAMTSIDTYTGVGTGQQYGAALLPWNNIILSASLDGAGNLMWVAQRSITATSGASSALAATQIEASTGFNSNALAGVADNIAGHTQNDGTSNAWIVYKNGTGLVARCLAAANDSTMTAHSWSATTTIVSGGSATYPALISDQSGSVYAYWIDTGSSPTYAIKRAKLSWNGSAIVLGSTTTIVAGGGTLRTYLAVNESSASSALLTYTEGAGTPWSVMMHLDNIAATSLSILPIGIPPSHAGNITLALTGIGTSWTGGTTFTVTNSTTGTTTVTKVSQNVTTGTAATLVVTTGAGTGTFTVSDGSLSAVVTVGTPTLAVAPSSAYNNSTTSLTLTGVNTAWKSDSPAFSIAGVAGASLSGIAWSTDTTATATLTTGATTGTATITDPSTGATTTLTVQSGRILPTDAALLYSPNWETPTSARARTNCCGAYVRAHFTGTTCLLTFDVSGNGSPFPQIAARIDRGPWKLYNAAASVNLTTTPLSVSTEQHLLEWGYNTYTGTGDRWTLGGAGSLSWTGMTLDAGATASAPQRRLYTFYAFGDSLTEGSSAGNLDGSSTGSSAFLSHAYTLGELLDAEMATVGFSGSGYISTGLAGSNVPALTGAYNLLASGVSRSFSGVDGVVLFDGHNDAGTTGAQQTAVTTVLNGLIAANGAMKIFVFRDLNGIAAAGESAAVTAVANANTSYTDTTGWISLTSGVDTGDGVHPYAAAHVGKIAPRMAATIMPVLHPSGGGSSGPHIGSPFVRG